MSSGTLAFLGRVTPLLALSDHTVSLLALAFSLLAIAAVTAVRQGRRDHERHQRERRAELEIVDHSFDTFDGKIREYSVTVRNLGAGLARDVRVEIVDGERTDPIGHLSWEFYPAAITIPAGSSVDLKVQVGMALITPQLRFRLLWSDDTSKRREADGPMCPRQHHPTFGFRPLVAWKSPPK